jgi:hypothetical protein
LSAALLARDLKIWQKAQLRFQAPSSMLSRQVTTVALLQARLDERLDYIELFMPLAFACIAQLRSDDGFTSDAFQGEMERAFGIRASPEVLKTMLRRAAKSAAIERSGGRYFVSANFNPEQTETQEQISKSTTQLLDLVEQINNWLEAKEGQVASGAATSDEVIDFLEKTQVPLLTTGAQDAAGFDRSGADPRQRQLARALLSVCDAQPQNRLVLNGILQGIVVRQALLLPTISNRTARLPDLIAYLDSNILVSLLGFEGRRHQLAASSFVKMLKEAGVSVRAFFDTIKEVRSILAIYEHRLTTPELVRTLDASEITINFLENGVRASDVVLMNALVESNLTSQYGVQIEERPNFETEFTEDEVALANLLREQRHGSRFQFARDPLKDPRVTHDVDCVAAILYKRRGRDAATIDNARAVFVTKSGLVVRKVGEWWESMGRDGVRPVVSQSWLSSLVWLKCRGVFSADCQLDSSDLLALCQSVLRPRQSTWAKFHNHLAQLVAEGVLTSDESTVLVCSRLMSAALSRLEDNENAGEEVDATNYREVILRVRQEESRDRQVVESQLAESNAKLQEVRSRNVQSAERIADALSWIFTAGLGLACASIAVAATVVSGMSLTWATVLVLALSCALTIVGQWWGITLLTFRAWTRSRLLTRLHEILGIDGL